MSKNPGKARIKQKDYEGFQYGPLRVERLGRFIHLSSQWETGDYIKFINSVKSKRPGIESEINSKIQELLTIIEQNNPIDLLTTISYKNCLADPEEYQESTHKGFECYVEFALSLITGHLKPGSGKQTTNESIKHFAKLISDIFEYLKIYYATESIDKKRERIEQEVRFFSILRYIFCRGDSYIEHHLDLINTLFKPHDTFLKKHFGMTTFEIISGIQEIVTQINHNFDILCKGAINIIKLHEIFIKYIDDEDTDNFLDVEEYIDKFKSLPEVIKEQQKLIHLQEMFERTPFQIKPNNIAKDELIQLLSTKIGENYNFLEFNKSPGWPTNDSIIYRKPLLNQEGKIYSFVPQLLLRNIRSILEDWIKQKDQHYFNRSYLRKRADFLLQKALEYFQKLLPNANIYRNQYYEVELNGQKECFETDAIILYDNNLFILEGKAGTLSISSRRGSIERMKRDTIELIDSAYSQALRTKRYIEETDKPNFKYKNGSESFVIHNKNNIENIFLINVTLESLGYLSTHLNSLKNFNLIQGKEWPWSVFINDLRVISEILESPTQFLLFLQRRIRANDFPGFYLIDELDFLMYFLNEGLYLEESELKNKSMYSLIGYTDELDRYYNFLGGIVSSGKKPTLKILPEFKELIKNIESLGKTGFAKITTILLGFSHETHNEIIRELKSLKGISDKDGEIHNLTLYFKKENLGVTFFIDPYRSIVSIKTIENHCKFKMYQTRFSNWIAIAIDSTKSKIFPYDLFIYKKKWEYDEDLEQRLMSFRKRKWEASGMIGTKIGQNQPCPCGSGLKYKKCCGRLK